MEADIEGMRAFVVTAEELHFGRSGARLFISQQALSKRIRRLEDALGAPLFERTTRVVALTEAGRRLLPHAREAVSAFDRAVRAARPTDEPLRVDVYDERFTPLRMVRRASEHDPHMRIELSMRQGLSAALPPLRRQEIDIVEPAPLMPWSVVWHRHNPSPRLRALLRRLRSCELPDPSDSSVWVPEIDLTPVGS